MWEPPGLLRPRMFQQGMSVPGGSRGSVCAPALQWGSPNSPRRLPEGLSSEGKAGHTEGCGKREFGVTRTCRHCPGEREQHKPPVSGWEYPRDNPWVGIGLTGSPRSGESPGTPSRSSFLRKTGASWELRGREGPGLCGMSSAGPAALPAGEPEKSQTPWRPRRAHPSPAGGAGADPKPLCGLAGPGGCGALPCPPAGPRCTGPGGRAEVAWQRWHWKGDTAKVAL